MTSRYLPGVLSAGSSAPAARSDEIVEAIAYCAKTVLEPYTSEKVSKNGSSRVRTVSYMSNVLAAPCDGTQASGTALDEVTPGE